MNQKSLYIVFSSVLLILFVLVYQGTYAYFTATVIDERGDVSSTLTTADLKDITLIDGENTEHTGWIPGDTQDFKFSIDNPGSPTLCVKLFWHDVTNEWENKDDLVYEVKDSEGNVVINKKKFPTQEKEELGIVEIKGRTTNEFTLTVTYEDTESIQNEDMNKTFLATISGELTECPTTGGGGDYSG